MYNRRNIDVEWARDANSTVTWDDHLLAKAMERLIAPCGVTAALCEFVAVLWSLSGQDNNGSHKTLNRTQKQSQLDHTGLVLYQSLRSHNLGHIW